MIYEDITIGDLKVKNQVIGIAQDVDIPLLEDVIWDGILGLAYANQNLKNLVSYINLGNKNFILQCYRSRFTKKDR